jgi:hypothetical protein
MIEVNSPYCDAYLPYTFHDNSIEQRFPDTALAGTIPSDSYISAFLNLKEGKSTAEAIPRKGSKKGVIDDPGYPIFPDPQRKLFADGSDLTRLITRLTAVNKAKPTERPVPFCKPIDKANQVQAASAYDPSTQYYLVHVVRWKVAVNKGVGKTGTTVGGLYETATSDWYVFNKSDSKAAHREFPFRFHPLVSGDKRIFGSNKVVFIAIHLAPQGYYQELSQNLHISYKLKVSKLTPANIQDASALFKVITGAAPAAAGLRANCPDADKFCLYQDFLKRWFGRREYDGLYAAASVENLQSLPVQITSTMNVDLPQIDSTVHNEIGPHTESELGKIFWEILGANTATSTSPAANSSSSTTAATPPADPPPAKDQTTTPGCSTVGNTGACSESFAVQNEGLYWWDVSIGIPFKGIKQLQFSSTASGQVTPRTISKGSAYGFLVLAPWKEDVVSPPSLGIPHVLIGLPLSGKVFDSPFVGLGETFNISKLPSIGPKISKIVPFGIRFYAGLVENKEFGPAPASGTAGPPSRWVGKLQYGIEFSVKDIANKLTSNTSKSNSKSSK